MNSQEFAKKPQLYTEQQDHVTPKPTELNPEHLLYDGKQPDFQERARRTDLESNLTDVSKKLFHLKDKLCSTSSGTRCVHYPWYTLNISGWATYLGNKTYFFSNEKLTWNNSRNLCLSMMSDLVVIDSEAEQEFIRNSAQITDSPYWIGLTDQNVEGSWCWVGDHACNTTNKTYWMEGNPSNSDSGHPTGEDCVTVNYNTLTLKTWNDESCYKTFRWICEKELAVVSI
ncbi:C-type lectin domain family 4 member E-like [Protopterus annectens]|uniref:C-type lectin domain family 4 member E-like n=1 Tax=Protopterus annectens TaxID=7888 RepID=UPI001CFC2609|nr:C-type lectin domain family 4 member E-like [Protopterus annectens]